jgi:conserved domain protein
MFIMSNSIKELLSKLSDMHNAEQDRLQKEEKEGENFNVFSALNMCSDEMRLHSRLLATLFNPKANHGLGNEFLRQFLVTAIKVDDNYITHCNESIAERYVGEVTETTGGRIDIILEDGKHGIIIENKIYASDQPNQLLRYHNYGVKQFGENNFKLVYLTLYGSEPSSDSLGGGHFEFIKLSYAQDILGLLEGMVTAFPQKPIHRTIKDYITIIKQLTYQDMDTKYSQSIINEAIDEKYIDATLELLQLTKQIGDALIEKYIIKKLIGFEQHKDDNGALWRDLNESYAIVIKTYDRTYWKKVWIGISPKKGYEQPLKKLDCFTDAPTKNYPYGWSWISDNANNNWHNPAQYPAIKKEEVLRWIEKKISEIEACFKN